MPSTRERMVISTVLLMREKGARATSIDDVLAHSGAPRGSVYHHFPGGRDQLLREATDYAREYVAGWIERSPSLAARGTSTGTTSAIRSTIKVRGSSRPPATTWC